MHLFIPIYFFTSFLVAVILSPIRNKHRKPRPLPKLILFIDDDPCSKLPVKRITGD